MLGGTVVNITGPCFEPGMKIRCKFDIVDVVGTVVDRNRAICVQPFLMAEGYVIFDIKIGEGQYNWKGKYFVETPATATERIYFETDAVHERYPQEIKITWDKYNLTSNLNTPVSISLYGYRETTITPELVYIDILEEGVANSGSYTIAPAAYRQRYNWDMHDVSLFVITSNPVTMLGSFSVPFSSVLWSKPIPLGWYFAPQWQRQFDSSKWEEYLCDDWIKNDRYLKNFASDVSDGDCRILPIFYYSLVIQKRIMRNINRKTWRTSCRDLFRKQNILTFYGLYYLEVMTTIKTNYDQNTIQLRNNARYNTRQNNIGLIEMERHRTTFYEKKKNYLYKGIWWNRLPLETKNMRMEIFKETIISARTTGLKPQLKRLFEKKETIKKIAIEKVPYSLKEIDEIHN
ncbi:hypothetical protein WDU94_012044 [Cyamophila willieti]